MKKIIRREIKEMVLFPGREVYFKDENNLGWLGTIFESYNRGMCLLVVVKCEDSPKLFSMIVYEDSVKGTNNYEICDIGQTKLVDAYGTEWKVVENYVPSAVGTIWQRVYD